VQTAQNCCISITGQSKYLTFHISFRTTVDVIDTTNGWLSLTFSDFLRKGLI